MLNNKKISIVECPRDAMQGWPHFIPTKKKIEYLNLLLQVGFDTLDFGSFVSPKAIPQMADTKEVLSSLDLSRSDTKLLAIIANLRGAQDAVVHESISFLGFPFSVSETFQQRNTNSSIADSLNTVQDIQELCIKNNKALVVYLSMGFGNPYGDEYNEEIVMHWAAKLAEMNISIISVADTVGVAKPDQVASILSKLITAFPGIETGVHLHSAPKDRTDKIEAALNAGCKRFDSAIRGIGGCPMAGDVLVGNMDTEIMAAYFEQKGLEHEIDMELLKEASNFASSVFV